MTGKEVKQFGAEVGKVLQLMIHSLYSNKDIFLRELISNASDACDKLRYLATTDNSLIDDGAEFRIQIILNEANRTVSVIDNGIGMSRDDLINNIGTIASSGTQKFLELLDGSNKQDVQLIGQFGVGFYSTFMVADTVTVVSKKAGQKEVWEWQSNGDGEYSIEKLKKSDLTRGTKITFKIRDGLDEYLDKFRIKHIIKTYSDHVSFPIELVDSEGVAEIVNTASALWMRNKSDITEEQYKDFYKQVAHLPDTPWMVIHNKNEGAVEFTNLLYIPTIKPFDLFNPDRKSRIKLYIKRVFIAEEGMEIVPSFLRFLRGVVDSEDLPLNISRESLQHNHILAKITRAITLKVISELKKKLENDREAYEEFWKDFGQVFKEGLCEANDYKEKMLEITLFKSALTNKYITLDEYKKNAASQECIYYLCGEESERLKDSPQLEGFLKNNIDVLLFEDTVDDFWVNVVSTYKESELKSVTRSDISLDNITGKSEESSSQTCENKQEVDHLLTYFKGILGKLVKDVKISGKLVDSPVCLSVAEGAMDIRMEKYLLDQKQIKGLTSKILEINPAHSVIKKVQALINSGDNSQAEDLVRILYDQACIIENQPVNDPSSFAKRFNSLLERIS
jgi:molecular chaperone HtpG